MFSDALQYSAPVHPGRVILSRQTGGEFIIYQGNSQTGFIPGNLFWYLVQGVQICVKKIAFKRYFDTIRGDLMSLSKICTDHYLLNVLQIFFWIIRKLKLLDLSTN